MFNLKATACLSGMEPVAAPSGAVPFLLGCTYATGVPIPHSMPLTALPSSVEVICGDLKGILVLSKGKIFINSGTSKEKEVSPTEFERLGGRAATKKWKQSIRLVAPDGTAGRPVGEWLQSFGLDIRSNTISFITSAVNSFPPFAVEGIRQTAGSEARAGQGADSPDSAPGSPLFDSCGVQDSDLSMEARLENLKQYIQGSTSEVKLESFGLEAAGLPLPGLDLRQLYLTVKQLGGYNSLKGDIELWTRVAQVMGCEQTDNVRFALRNMYEHLFLKLERLDMAEALGQTCAVKADSVTVSTVTSADSQVPAASLCMFANQRKRPPTEHASNMQASGRSSNTQLENVTSQSFAAEQSKDGGINKSHGSAGSSHEFHSKPPNHQTSGPHLQPIPSFAGALKTYSMHSQAAKKEGQMSSSQLYNPVPIQENQVPESGKASVPPYDEMGWLSGYQVDLSNLNLPVHSKLSHLMGLAPPSLWNFATSCADGNMFENMAAGMNDLAHIQSILQGDPRQSLMQMDPRMQGSMQPPHFLDVPQGSFSATGEGFAALYGSRAFDAAAPMQPELLQGLMGEPPSKRAAHNHQDFVN